MMNTNSEFSALRARIWSHPFEDPKRQTDLARRLVKEQGWNLHDAREAIEEYRKFCFLAVISCDDVTPSHSVDLVWHTHLLYTRDYWDVFVPRILGRALHHAPGDGSEEKGHFNRQYAHTLDLYKEHFGPAPSKWWPAEEHARDSTTERWGWFPLHGVWVIRKPYWMQKWMGKIQAIFHG